jgi:tRNA (guanine37-N1)-methyltransferase
MKFEIFTLFPDYFSGPFGSSILHRAQASGSLEIGLHDIRDWTTDQHRTADDAPYGGGAGMVMKAEPIAAALENVLGYDAGDVEQPVSPPCPVIHLSPRGRTLTHEIAVELAGHERLALLCGHYEGIDERAVQLMTTDAISIGDYVLTGGEAAAVILVDAVTRLLPGVLGNADSAKFDSFADGLLEASHYTRPASWRGYDVPKVLLSGDHGAVAKWRTREGMRHTLQHRPELLDALLYGDRLNADELKILGEVLSEYRSIFSE